MKSQITVETDVVYGINFSAYVPAGMGGPQLIPQMCDLYYPDTTIDKATDRPVVIYLHTGSFLPKGLVSPMGDRKDSAAVEICTRLAQMGYVAISASYRVGWLANSTQLDLRRGSNLLAVYNAVQDAKAAVRFLHKTVIVDGNPYHVNPNVTFLIGQGSGGYVALAYATIDKYSEITQDSKFQYQSTQGVFGGTVSIGDPYIDTAVFGDWNGHGGKVTLTGGTTPLGLPEIDLNAQGRNFENYKGLPDDIVMTVNLGGALGDSLWLEQGDVPMVSAHCRYDFYAPYYKGMVQVPVGGTFYPVIEVAGSHRAIKHANLTGNNDIFVNANLNDALSVSARNNQYNIGNYEGLLTFNITPPDPSTPWEVNSNPWDFWDPSDPMGANETNPNNKAQSKAYIDTVMNYMTPRMALVLAENGYQINVKEFDTNRDFRVFPSPATEKLNVVLMDEKQKISAARVYSLTGKMVMENRNIDANQHTFDVQALSPGVYILNLEVDGMPVTKKFVKQ